MNFYEKRGVRIFLALTVAVTTLFFCSCADDGGESQLNNLLLLGTLAGAEQGRGHTAMVDIPGVMAAQTDTGYSGSSTEFQTMDAIPQGNASVTMKGVYVPVRASLYIGDQLLYYGGRMVTEIERVLTVFPGLLNLGAVTATYNDNADPDHPGRVIQLEEGTTFGPGGRKASVWYTDTGTDALRDGVKLIELEYRATDESGNVDYTDLENRSIDGVLFVRYLPDERPDEYTVLRVEFQKKLSDGTRTAWIWIENHLNLNWDEVQVNGNSVLFLSEDAQGNVTTEGGYSTIGVKMPFKDEFVAPDWQASTERVYLFKAAGSAKINKAVVNVVFPLRSDSLSGTPFADAQAWSLGELFTDGLLQYMNDTNVTVEGIGTITMLQLVNLLQGSVTLDLASPQADILTALNAMAGNPLLSDPSAQLLLQDLQVVTGIRNPAYFYKSGFTNTLVGQDDSSGLDKYGIVEYDALEDILVSGAFSSGASDQEPVASQFPGLDGLYTIDIVIGTGIDHMTDHSGLADVWTDGNVPVPAPPYTFE